MRYANQQKSESNQGPVYCIYRKLHYEIATDPPRCIVKHLCRQVQPTTARETQQPISKVLAPKKHKNYENKNNKCGARGRNIDPTVFCKNSTGVGSACCT